MNTSPAVVAESYATSMTEFSFSLFRELGTSVEGNLFASTCSINFLLMLLALGSKYKTNDELMSVLRLPKQKSPNYENFKTILENIEDPDYLKIANGIFANKSFDLSADYEYQARNYLKSEVTRVDFASNSLDGESQINNWCKNKTNGKIVKLFDSGSITEETVLVLASAVHFQSTWKTKFTETKTAMFCLSAADHIEIQMMHTTGRFRYYKDNQNKFAAIELPYRGGFEMLVLLPDKMDAVHSLEKTFLSDSKIFSNLLANMTKHNVVLDLPKFKFESDLNLKETMEKLGVSKIFTSEADFSNMTSNGAGNMKVNKIKHKTFVDVSEKGTEAAGVTGADIVLYKLEYTPPDIKTVKFYACHPFLFIIKKGDYIVFMGRLANPNA